MPQPNSGLSESASVKVEVNSSMLAALVEFSKACAMQPFSIDALKKRCQKVPDYARLSAVFQRAFDSSSHVGYWPRVELPQAWRPRGTNFHDLVSVLAVSARDIDHLGQLLRSLMPAEVLGEFIDALKQLKPFYEEHYFKPGQSKLLKVAKAYRALFVRAEREKQLFSRMAQFYRTTGVDRSPFIWHLSYIGESRQSHAHGTDFIEFVEVPDNDSVGRRFGVIAHEMAHSFYNRQPMELQQQLAQAFEATAPNRVAAPYFNEAVATAIGNGIVSQWARGETAANWYAHPVIDRFAHALKPLIEARWTSGQPMDVTFVHEAAAAFETAFPRWNDSPAIACRTLSVVHDETLPKDTIRSWATRTFRNFTINYSNGALDNAATWEPIQREKTCVVILANGTSNNLKFAAPEFQKRVETAASGFRTYAARDAAGRLWFGALSDKAADLERLLISFESSLAEPLRLDGGPAWSENP